MIRNVESVWQSVPAIEGAGVYLRRVFGHAQMPKLDPFLLLDDFSSTKPVDYLAGFPWHPHRGIETVTYIVKGRVSHEDNLGNKGTINSGDVQWMTAGSGIIHQEMPQESERMIGFQLWVNLPSTRKMMAPRYHDVGRGEIPEVDYKGALVKVIAGSVGNVKGPVQDLVVSPEYIDVSLQSLSTFEHPIVMGHKAFAYVVEGDGHFDPNRVVKDGEIAVFTNGDDVSITAGSKGLHFLLIAGKPLNEPVAWYGPIVMNTQQELVKAFGEYSNGTFIKHKPQI
ncbi:MAG: pirin family protein [Thaumarchaeota archaeon]|nr:pirin family protein [Nitrososphaerota archaeon]